MFRHARPTPSYSDIVRRRPSEVPDQADLDRLTTTTRMRKQPRLLRAPPLTDLDLSEPRSRSVTDHEVVGHPIREPLHAPVVVAQCRRAPGWAPTVWITTRFQRPNSGTVESISRRTEAPR